MKSRNKGFTLVELLVVIGIIALLISILLPTLGRVRNAAQSIACQSNLRQLYQITLMYSTENKEFIPVPNVSATEPLRSADSRTATLNTMVWYNALPKYINMKPMGPGGNIRLWNFATADKNKYLDTGLSGRGTIFICPAAASRAGIAVRRTYAMNEFLKQNGHDKAQFPQFAHSGDAGVYPLKIGFLKNLINFEASSGGGISWTDLPMYTDGYWRPEDTTPDVNFYPSRSIELAGNGWRWSDLRQSRPHLASNSSGFSHRSNPYAQTETDLPPGGINVVYLDGHVDSVVPNYSSSRFNPLDGCAWKNASKPSDIPDMYW